MAAPDKIYVSRNFSEDNSPHGLWYLNKSKTLTIHLYDKEYNYTKEDEKEQEEDYAMHYYGALNRFGL